MGPKEAADKLNETFTPANRKQRRTFNPDDPDKTKATWSRQTKKELKRKRKLGRK